MSASHFIVLSRRLWAVRDELADAYLQFNAARHRALLRREARLVELVTSYEGGNA